MLSFCSEVERLDLGSVQATRLLSDPLCSLIMRVLIPTVSVVQRHTLENLLDSVGLAWRSPATVELDFSSCSFLSAEAVAILAGLFFFRKTTNGRIVLAGDTITGRLRDNLWKMGFLELFGSDRCSAPANSLPIYRQSRHDHGAIVRCIEQVIMGRPEMPTMSIGLAKEIRRSFVELFDNIFNHSGSPIGGLVCGQVYPHRKLLQVTFYDAGVGLSRNVRNTILGIADDPTAISWALQPGNSTLSAPGSEPRGLGLYWIREFLKVNGGELQVYANSGYYRERGATHDSRQTQTELLGTLVDLRIRIQPGALYQLTSEARNG